MQAGTALLKRAEQQGSLPLAEAAIHELAVAAELGDGLALYNRGAAYVLSHRLGASERSLDLAIRDFQKALDLDPGDDDSLFNLAVCRLRKRDYEAAAALFDRCAERQPEDPTIYFYRAEALEHFGSERYQSEEGLVRAIEDYSRCIELDPTRSRAYYNRGVCYEYIGGKRYSSKANVERAIRDYDVAIGLDESFSWTFNNRAWCLARLGDLESAERDLKIALAKASSAERAEMVRTIEEISRFLEGEDI